ncbi:hypothetical protein [Tenacibaculum sp. E3R01]|uniref:hypothetical protein n=1 Tax=Tenacibaculum sp. E3R01 TaxID=2267227 RepID=UPI0011BDD25B|nr:hypothetical protein [Tenacibaculum sp. E3R01]
MWCIKKMKIEESKFRCGNGKAIKELVAKYAYLYSDWMQDWPYDIAESKEIENYFQHYDEQIDEDKKFSLMEMLIQALTDIEDKNDFDKNWKRLKSRIIKDFEIHEYTILYWSCFGENLSDCWKVTPYIRELWKEIKNG